MAAGDKQRAATAEFVAGIRAATPVPRQRAGVLLRAVASEITEAVIVGNQYGPGTPVDTGFARGSWYATHGDETRNSEAPVRGPNRKPVASADALTQGAIDAATLAIVDLEIGDTFGLVNDAAYIVPLNDGHSDQAPAGIVDPVVAQFSTIVDDQARRLGLL